MRPLSLEMFAEAESWGCGLEVLMSGDSEIRTRGWLELYGLLSGLELEQVTEQALSDPPGFSRFTEHVQSSFGENAEAEAEPSQSHRRTKDPRERLAQQAQSMVGEKTAEVSSPASPVDYSLLFQLSRFTHVPLRDIYQMTFAGLSALMQYLEDHPPQAGNIF